MKKKIFTIHDEIADAYFPPFLLDNENMAIRVMIDCLTDPNHNFAKHPADYTLFLIGEFDNDNGELIVLLTKKPLGNLLDLKPQEKPSP